MKLMKKKCGLDLNRVSWRSNLSKSRILIENIKEVLSRVMCVLIFPVTTAYSIAIVVFASLVMTFAFTWWLVFLGLVLYPENQNNWYWVSVTAIIVVSFVVSMYLVVKEILSAKKGKVRK